MKIAIFSDIHGNKQALKSILDDIKRNNIDKVYCLGDVIGIGPNPKESLDLIIENKINMILGNHELYYLKGNNIEPKMGEGEKNHQKWIKEQLKEKHKKFLDNCPIKIEELIENINIQYQHFLFDNNKKEDEYPFCDLKIVKDSSFKEKVKFLNANITFIGHEHKDFQIENVNRKVICVGSSGCNKNDETFYTILTVEDNKLTVEKRIIFYDRDAFEKSFKKSNYPEKEIINKIFFGVSD